MSDVDTKLAFWKTSNSLDLGCNRYRPVPENFGRFGRVKNWHVDNFAVSNNDRFHIPDGDYLEMVWGEGSRLERERHFETVDRWGSLASEDRSWPEAAISAL